MVRHEQAKFGLGQKLFERKRNVQFTVEQMYCTRFSVSLK